MDLHGEEHAVAWSTVFKAADRLQAFFNAVGLRFVERGELLEKLLYAFMMREHVLIDGPTGAAKSDILDTIMENITDATVWSMDLTKFTQATHLFGAFDVRRMKEDGHMVHMTEGSLAEANFAKVGEFFDSSDPTLRTLLGVMNERRVRRGPQLIDLPLMTMVADTNFKPEDMPHRSSQLDAVVDRFLFRHSVSYVQDPRNRYAMLEMALESSNRSALPKLSLSDVVIVSGVVRAVDLVKDRYVREAYQQMTWEFSQARVAHGKPPLSDRRYIRGAQIMEASAILRGRNMATFDDLACTIHVLGQTREDLDLLEEARHKALEKWVAAAQRREIDKEIHDLETYTKRMSTPDLTKLTHAQLKQLAQQLITLREEMKQFQPRSIEVRDMHTKALTRIHETLSAIDLRTIEVLVSHLPQMPEHLDEQHLIQVKRAAQHVENELRVIDPRSDKAIIAHAQALEMAGRLVADIETEFSSLGKTPQDAP